MRKNDVAVTKWIWCRPNDRDVTGSIAIRERSLYLPHIYQILFFPRKQTWERFNKPWAFGNRAEINMFILSGKQQAKRHNYVETGWTVGQSDGYVQDSKPTALWGHTTYISVVMLNSMRVSGLLISVRSSCKQIVIQTLCHFRI